MSGGASTLKRVDWNLLVGAGDVGLHGWLVRWAPLAEWLVAIGTSGLAAATFVLARRARDEAAAVRNEATIVAEQVQLQREQSVAATRPAVYPVPLFDWTRGAGVYSVRSTNDVLPIKNGGPGLALNVHGACFARDPDSLSRPISLELYAGTLAANESFDATTECAVPHGWATVEGFILYNDILGDEWVTHFKCGLGRGGRLIVGHEPPGRVADLGDPRDRYSYSLDR